MIREHYLVLNVNDLKDDESGVDVLMCVAVADVVDDLVMVDE